MLEVFGRVSEIIWLLSDDAQLMDSGKHWDVQLLSKCMVQTRDLVIMTILPIWQIRNDITHGENATQWK